jgi:hypothetical protein
MAKLPSIFPDPSSDDPPATLRRARRLWQLCLMLPFVYVGAAFAIDRLFFTSGFGFWAVTPTVYRRILLVFAALAVCAQVALVVLHRHFQARIREVRLSPARAALLYHRRTIYMAACADAVSGLGLIAFLINADWMALIVFCVVSYFLYVQAYPRGRFVTD